MVMVKVAVAQRAISQDSIVSTAPSEP